MSQNDLQRELDKLFTFERNISAPYLELSRKYRLQKDFLHANIELKSEEYGVSGVAEHYHLDNDGAVIYEYAVDREIRRSGPQLPGPMDMLQDCEHHYYGLKLSCLAFLSEQRIKKLVLRDCYNGVSIGITYNPRIAQIFIAHIAKSTNDAPVHAKKLQPTLFA